MRSYMEPCLRMFGSLGPDCVASFQPQRGPRRRQIRWSWPNTSFLQLAIYQGGGAHARTVVNCEILFLLRLYSHCVMTEDNSSILVSCILVTRQLEPHLMSLSIEGEKTIRYTAWSRIPEEGIFSESCGQRVSDKFVYHCQVIST